MNTIQIEQPVKSIADLTIQPLNRAHPSIPDGECLIEVHAAAINPSDVKGVLGSFQHALWPRVPGRDYAGVVMNGPEGWVGKEVWGTGGDLGITRDGTFSRYLLVSTAALSEKPKSMTMIEAASVGVPFITAYHGLVHLARLTVGEVLVVFGANGQVGSAAMQIAKLVAAKVIGVARTATESLEEHSVLNASDDKLQEEVRSYTKGKGADVVLNCVGKPYFEQAQACLGKSGRQVLLSTSDPEDDVSLNVLDFYRKEQQLLGVNTMHLDHVECAKILNVLRPAFEEGVLLPPSIHPSHVFPLTDAKQIFQAMMKKDIGKCVFEMKE